ncbi:MAG: RhuM family protein [Saprospiraceae bacterium]
MFVVANQKFLSKSNDIYATSIDYKKDDDQTKQFFATVQNKMHYAVHGLTAAEMINNRVNADKPFLGLTNFKKTTLLKDVGIAKNYLSEAELKQLNLIVTLTT